MDVSGSDDIGHSKRDKNIKYNSSGYDSTEISETESPSTNVITANRQTSGHVGVQEVLKFRSPHALCESLKLILQVPEMCDIMFLVGPREMPVFGVRAVLSARSSVFYRLILRHLQAENGCPAKRKTTTGNCRFPLGHLVIPVRKYHAEVLRMLIHFVHCGSVTVTEDTVTGLLCGAMQFELPDMACACWGFVHGCLLAGRADRLLAVTRCYVHHRVSQAIFDKIYSFKDGKQNAGRPCQESVV